VFLFFALMATCGTSYVVGGTVTAAAWWAGTSLGLLAVAILVANNLRDIPTDEAAGKHTLAVRLGERRTRLLYRACIVGAFAVICVGILVFLANEAVGISQWALFALVAWPLAIAPMDRVGSASGRDLIPVLTGTAALEAGFGAMLALGLILGRIA
jgi:1,4-dihydroxy-2-naphthoate octaprenyltransferase